jgi:hypothetical protein
MAPLVPAQDDQIHNSDIIDCNDSNSVFSSSNSSLLSTTTNVALDDSKEKLAVNTKQKKSVRFTTYSELYYIPSLDEYDRSDLAKVYLSQKDKDRISNENHHTLLAMNHGVYPDSDFEYFRGLEGGMRWFSVQRKNLVRATVSAVLQEQMAHGRDLDASWVQHYYSGISASSVLSAIRVGIWDAQVARTIFEEEVRLQSSP